ncbi:MAG: D-alanyl-D-alanine carboxypeptidase family protein [Candidatus Dormibacteria bacterium]
MCLLLTAACGPALPAPGASTRVPVAPAPPAALFTADPAFSPAAVPPVDAATWVIADARTGRFLAGSGEHQRRAMASTTKMTTAMVALDLASPDQVVSVPDDATHLAPDYSVAGLRAGQRVTVRQLLEATLIPSGSDAAETLAQTLVPRDRFLSLMNQKVAGWGLMDTHYVNPFGADEEGQYSSAFDLAVIGYHVVHDYPVLAGIVDRSHLDPSLTFQPRAGEEDNTNQLLDTYPGVVGVKTGNTNLAGHCLVLDYRHAGTEIIAALMGSEDSFGDGRILLDAARNLDPPPTAPGLVNA